MPFFWNVGTNIYKRKKLPVKARKACQHWAQVLNLLGMETSESFLASCKVSTNNFAQSRIGQYNVSAATVMFFRFV